MAPRPRRPKGSIKNPTALGYVVAGDSKTRFDSLAARAGVSSAAFFESVVDHIEVTDQGLPVWWPTELPRDGELPIDAL